MAASDVPTARAPQCVARVGFISQGFDHCSYYRRTSDAAGLEIDSAGQRSAWARHPIRW
jgi:hypothetical protein